MLWPRNAGSYPGYVFTGEPLKLAAGHFGLDTAAARTRRMNITSSNPRTRKYRDSTAQ